MIPLMKFHSLWRLNILEVIWHYEFFLKHASTQVLKDQNAIDKAINKRKKEKKLLIPPMTEERLKTLNDITSITMEMNHVSWAKISTLNFALLEWDAIELPMDFRNNMNELEILSLGNLVQEKIPRSDLYVVENYNNYKIKLNELYLKIALLVHINNFNRGSATYGKIVFQNPRVLNFTYKLLVGRERRTTKHIVENIFSLQENRSNDNVLNMYSYFKISNEMIQNFANYNRTKQESLSLALLIGLSFLNLNFIENYGNYTSRKTFNPLRFS